MRSPRAWPSDARDPILWKLRRKLRDGVPDADMLLFKFSAGFAKWQYETLAECTCQLRPLRQIAKRFIGEDTYSHFQDREMPKAVVGACRN